LAALLLRQCVIWRVDGGWYWSSVARMGSIGRYIFRTTFGAFLLVLVSITGLMWITQALHDVDLVTSQGQSVLTFIGVTGLFILAYELHKLRTCK
jgi:hypothetical protein